MLKALHMNLNQSPRFNKSDLKSKYLYVSGLYLIILWQSGGGGSGPPEHNGGKRLQTSVAQQRRRSPPNARPAVHIHSAPFLVRFSLAWERNQHHTGNAHTSHMLFMLMWRMWVRERAFSQTCHEDKLVRAAQRTMRVYVSMCPHMCVCWGVITAENKIISTSNENRKLRKKCNDYLFSLLLSKFSIKEKKPCDRHFYFLPLFKLFSWSSNHLSPVSHLRMTKYADLSVRSIPRK